MYDFFTCAHIQIFSSETHGVTVIGVGSLSFLGDNPHYMRVTIQEYLTLLPGYG